MEATSPQSVQTPSSPSRSNCDHERVATCDHPGGIRLVCNLACILSISSVYVGMSVRVITADSVTFLYQEAFDAHWKDVFRFCLAWTNDWASAEDLAQETYVRLWQSRNRLDWHRPVLPWLLVAARRLATDRFRLLRRHILGTASTGGLEESVHVRWLDVQAAMAGLSPLERTALVLTAIEGMSYTEVAESLGTSAAALRAAVSRARTKLEDAQ